jgi:hypothetical protein
MGATGLSCENDIDVTNDRTTVTRLVPSKNTRKNSINELLAAGEIEQFGKGGKGHEYRYFSRGR